jgi:hypothetical protein
MTEKDVDMLAEHIYTFSLNSVKHIARKHKATQLRKQHAH